MGYDGFDDLIENEKVGLQFGENFKDAADDFDLSLACKRFPSIVLGSSPPVELYNDSMSCSQLKSILATEVYKGYIQDTLDLEWAGPDIPCEKWPSVHALLGVSSSMAEELKAQNLPIMSKSGGENAYTLNERREANTSSLPVPFPDMTLETEEKSYHDVSIKESYSEAGPESQILDAAFLDRPINFIPGLSKRQCRQLENCGFHTLRKLLHHFPRTYADLQNVQVGIDDGQYLISVGKVLSSRGVRTRSSFAFLEVVVSCEIEDNGSQDIRVGDNDYGREKRVIYLHLKRFFSGTRFTSQPFLRCLEEKHKPGELVCVSGKVRGMHTKDHYEIRDYNIDVVKDCGDSSLHAESKPYPIYPSKGGLSPDFLRNVIARAVQVLPSGVDPIPREIAWDFGLLCLRDAYSGIHQPKNVGEADLARKRLLFDEFFYLQLGRLFQMLEGLGTPIEKKCLLDKYRIPELSAVYVEDWSGLTKKFLKAIPYSLTSSQLSAVSEIIWDLKRPVPMNRLLQGEVGCGKTIVAFLACMEVIGSGYQAAFMVPTELLAIQHYELLLDLLEKVEEDQFKPSIALLTGSTPLKQSRMIRQDLQSGDISMVIGTHSLISEKVEFSALRIAVVDEQHRFGVIQRGRFNSKLFHGSQNSGIAAVTADKSSKGDLYMAPHVLALSATPIPRTLALALYGDMSLTQITGLPPGRLPVETHIIEGNSDGLEDVYKMMLDELEAGGKVYLVYPIIEQSEQLPQLHAASADLESIACRFQDYNCGLLHGKMKSDEKDEALQRFRSGETRILLSTQVIEIGVDVPDASMMIVMNAERFGIAQLHQLRGRVGRGTKKSKCVLLTSTASSLERLRVLEKSSDGFYLANMDLLLRGPGDLLGKKQSGHLPEFPLARLEMDGNILQESHAAVLVGFVL
uniref:DNA 3'-5' helicase n=1 Tax=Rhizophora mucronata TaxID=61149 RepID=A0A2P2LYI8_RHIMU